MIKIKYIMVASNVKKGTNINTMFRLLNMTILNVLALLIKNVKLLINLLKSVKYAEQVTI